MFLTDGWAQIALLRRQYDAIDHFNTEDYEQFVLEFGAPLLTFNRQISSQPDCCQIASANSPHWGC